MGKEGQALAHGLRGPGKNPGYMILAKSPDSFSISFLSVK